MGRAGPGRAGLGRAGLGWAGLGWAGWLSFISELVIWLNHSTNSISNQVECVYSNSVKVCEGVWTGKLVNDCVETIGQRLELVYCPSIIIGT